MNTTATTVHNPQIARRSIRLVALLAALVAALSVLVLTPSSAEAYANTYWSGRQGSIRWGYTGGQIVAQPGYRFTTPVVIVGRNGAVNASYQQEVQARFDLQRWYPGTGWVNVDGLTQQVYADMGVNGVAVVGGNQMVSRVASPGYFRVLTTISWGSSIALPWWTGVYTGHQQYAPNSNSDLRCTFTRCGNYGTSNGAFYVSG